MMRSFDGKQVELLAPAGNFEIFESIVHSKCDAIYLGGQAFNMRMIRKGFNFSDDELVQAAKMAHQNDKKLYITVNNLIDEDQLDDLKTYLKFLDEKVCPDALIVQDMAVLQLIKTMGLGLEVHSSVMMNVHNLDMIKLLEQEGVTRVVLSREMSLEEVHFISERTDVELEYFTHGDMCIAHGSQCYYSSLLFGMSSNRGRCLKPCRWWFDTGNGKKEFPLAVKDLSLYRHLPQMIEAGVGTFKIEGRMREKGFITDLVNMYGDALDRYIKDPTNYNAYGDYDRIYETRKRELSTAYAFGNPGSDNINTLHEGTGKFYSTGKMFSIPTPEKNIDDVDQLKIENILSEYKTVKKIPGNISKKISVKVQNMDQAQAAIDLGVDRVYLAGDIYYPQRPFDVNQIRSLKNSMKTHQELFVTTPRMMNETQKQAFAEEMDNYKDIVDGILITQMGALSFNETWKLAGDYTLNIYNSEAKTWYDEHGLGSATSSIEMTASQLGKLSSKSSDLELVVYGQLASMYFEHDFFDVLDEKGDVCEIKNEAGVYTLLKDQYNKTHLLTTHSLNLLPVMDQIRSLNIDIFRIEAQSMSTEELEGVIKALKEGRDYKGEQQTFGALRF